MDKMKCFVCGNLNCVICWCVDRRKAFCRDCFRGEIGKNGLHVLIGGKFRAEEWGKLWKNIKTFEEFTDFVRKRIERLRFLKEKSVMEIQLAGEELKRLIDKEILKIIKEFVQDCDESEQKMVKVLQDLSENSQKVLKIPNHERISAEPLEFDLVTEPLLESLTSLVQYKLKDLEETNEKIVFFTEEFTALNVFIPEENRIKQLSKQRLRLTKNSAACIVPNDWVFVAGGVTGRSCSNFCQRFRINRSKVFDVQPMNEARFSFGMIYEKGAVYVFGGKNERKVLRECEKFLIKTKEWVVLDGMAEGKFEVSVVKMSGNVFICGMGSGKIEMFDCVNERFSVLIDKSKDEFGRLVQSLDDRLVLLCGQKRVYIDCEDNKIVAEDKLEASDWKGTCSPVIFNNWVYFDVCDKIWKINLFSNALLEHND